MYLLTSQHAIVKLFLKKPALDKYVLNTYHLCRNCYLNQNWLKESLQTI